MREFRFQLRPRLPDAHIFDLYVYATIALKLFTLTFLLIFRFLGKIISVVKRVKENDVKKKKKKYRISTVPIYRGYQHGCLRANRTMAV